MFINWAKNTEKLCFPRATYPKIHLQSKFPFMRRKETISAGSFIGRDHLQTVNLALIALASSLDTGIQTQDYLRRRAGCLGMQVFGSFRLPGGNSVSECRPAFPGRRTGQRPGRVQLPVVAVYFPATDVPLGVIKFHIVADC